MREKKEKKRYGSKTEQKKNAKRNAGREGMEGTKNDKRKPNVRRRKEVRRKHKKEKRDRKVINKGTKKRIMLKKRNKSVTNGN